MQFTVVIVDAAATQPVTTLQADNKEQGWEKRRSYTPSLTSPWLLSKRIESSVAATAYCAMPA